MKLLQRPSPIPSESWPGYLLRLSERNHYKNLAVFATLFAMSPQQLVAANPADTLKRLKIPLPTDVSLVKSLRSTAKPKLSSSGRSLFNKVCSVCLQESNSAYLKSVWDRAFACVCVLHDVYLLDACPRCKRPLSYLRRRLSRCNCGFYLQDAQTEQADIGINQLFSSVGISASHDATHVTFGPSTPLEVNAVPLIRRLLRLASREEKSTSLIRGISTQPFVSVRECRQVLPWLERWPLNFIERAVAARGDTKKDLKRMVFGAQWKTSENFPQIRQALLHYSRCVSESHPSANSRFQILMCCEGLTKVCLELGPSPHSFNLIKYWLFQKWLTPLQPEQMVAGPVRYLIEHEEALVPIQLMHRCVLLNEIVEEENVDWRVVHAFVYSGCLLEVAPKFGQHLVLRKDFDELKARLRTLAIQTTLSQDKVAPFDEVLKCVFKRSPFECGDLVHETIKGTVPLYASPGSPDDLRSLRYLPHDLRKWGGW